jgi:hypothetical protein
MPISVTVALLIWKKFQDGPELLLAKMGISLAILLAIFLISWLLGLFNVVGLMQSVYARIFENTLFYGGYRMAISYANAGLWMHDATLRNYWYHIILLSIPGLLIAWRLKNFQGWLLLSVLIPYLLIASFFTVHFDRWLLPPFIFLTFLAALFLEAVYNRVLDKIELNNRFYVKGILILIIVLLAGPAIYKVCVTNYVRSQDDVRIVAGHWLQENLPVGSTVVIDDFGPYVSSANHNVIYTSSIATQDLQEYQAQGVDYLVGNERNLLLWLNERHHPDPEERQKVEQQLIRVNIILTQLTVEKEFIGADGVRIRLYKVP